MHGKTSLIVMYVKLTAVFYSSLDELVRDGVNGLVFRDADQLASQLEVWTIAPVASFYTNNITSHRVY